MSRGIRLDDLGRKRFTWVDLRAFIRHLPPSNALARQRNGEAALWSADTWLLALVVDVLRAGNWQRGGDKRAAKPKPIDRPRLHGADPATAGDATTRGRGEGVTMDVMAKRLGWGDDGRHAAR